jgi:ABC-type glycerol-3-phosphate transport system substrate-binding protein
MSKGITRKTLFFGLIVTFALVAAFGATTASFAKSAAHKKVTITVNGLPIKTDTTNRNIYMRNVGDFENKYPWITVKPKEGLMDPPTFESKIAAGTLENVFYVYFTDPATVIPRHVAVDLTKYVKKDKIVKQMNPQLLKIFKNSKGHLFGIPWKNYTLGLLYSRTLFTAAGLNPNKPPTTWDAVRADAKKIAALGGGKIGYGEYSAYNTGGWHFTAEMFSRGGRTVTKNKASFNNAKGTAILSMLKAMRWTDNSVGTTQLLGWSDLLNEMAAGTLGMQVGALDNITWMANSASANINHYGFGVIPGTAASNKKGKGTLAGGDGWMIYKKSSAAQVQAGLLWIEFAFDNPNHFAADDVAARDGGGTVGLPEPNIWKTGSAAEKKFLAMNKKYRNVPTQYYTPFVKGMKGVQMVPETVKAQDIYAVLDTPMAQVLTNSGANVASLLSAATTAVNGILAAA